MSKAWSRRSRAGCFLSRTDEADLHRLAGDDDLHATLPLYGARALRELGRLDAAREVLMKALSRPKKPSQDVLLALRYERALVYEARGEHRAARAELEKILAAGAGYADVRARLSR